MIVTSVWKKEFPQLSSLHNALFVFSVAMASIPPPVSQDAMLAKQVTGGELSEEQKKQLDYQRQVCIFNNCTIEITDSFYTLSLLVLLAYDTGPSKPSCIHWLIAVGLS